MLHAYPYFTLSNQRLGQPKPPLDMQLRLWEEFPHLTHRVKDGVEGFLVPPDDIDAIADAIRKLAENPDLRVQMGMAARRRVEPLDIQHYRVRLGEIYREALG